MSDDDTTPAQALRIAPPGQPSVNRPAADDDGALPPLAGLEAEPDPYDDGAAPGGVRVVEDDQVRRFLEQVGGGLHRLTRNEVTEALAPELWLWDERDLDELVPPLTRVLNKLPVLAPLRRAVHHSDYATAASLLGAYLASNGATTVQLARYRSKQQRPPVAPEAASTEVVE